MKLQPFENCIAPLMHSLVKLVAVAGILSTTALAWATPQVDNSIYADLLDRYVKAGNVNYAGFKSEEKKLDEYLKVLEQTDPADLARNEQFAFYINVYNAWTIKLILTGYPGVKSIKELGGLFQGPWKKKFVRLNDGVVTLDDIEHNILRPRFKDPRVHFAINCASKSCPPLIPEPYQGEILNRQLSTTTGAFLNNPRNYRFDSNTFYISKIFKWFGSDFNNDPLGFYLDYAVGDLKQELEGKKDTLNLTYLKYDWKLNGK